MKMNLWNSLEFLAHLFCAVMGFAFLAMVAPRIRWVAQQRWPALRRPRWVTLGAFLVLYGFYSLWLWRPFLMPPVSYTVTAVSPSGECRVVVEDITHERSYETYGWRLRVRFELVSSGRPIGQSVMLRYHHSGMDEDMQMPKPIDVRIAWNVAGDKALVAYGDTAALMPGGYTFPECVIDILCRFPEGIPSATNDMP
jgi:hypothetical protein